jgi:hypothetical protein
MQFERELACDLAVVSGSPKQRAMYAECLIEFARLNSAPNPTNWGIDFASSSDQLKARIHSILAESKKSPPWLIGSRVACGLALLAGFVAVAPSLGVLLTYAQRQIVQPLAAEIRPARPESDNRTSRTNRKSKLQRSAVLPIADVSLANVSQTAESAASAPQNDNILASTSNNQGPQLLHRGEASAKPSRQQTVIPIDDPSGTGKAGDRDHQQALQQTATAAAVLKRLSTFDRH